MMSYTQPNIISIINTLAHVITVITLYTEQWNFNLKNLYMTKSLVYAQ